MSMFLAAALGGPGALYLLLRQVWPTWYQDVVTMYAGKDFVKHMKAATSNGWFLIDIFEQRVKESPQKSLIIHEDVYYTYEYMDKKANQACRTGIEIGVPPGSVVAVLMYNEPAFIWTYLGFMKAGYQIAFINFNLRSKSLAHCINVSGANVLIVGAGSTLAHNIEEILTEIPKVMVYYMGSLPEPRPARFLSWDIVMSRTSNEPIDRSIRKHLTKKTPNVLIFTSGTTGLSKAAIIPHERSVSSAYAFDMFQLSPNDILYEPLPMYHAVALSMGFGNVISHGATMVLRDKFSATHFWDDVRKYDVTVIHYIGEVCRYLLARPKSKDDGVHKVRIATGNGLRQDIWEEFKTRFKIPKIVEFYGSTEGTTGFINVTNKTGAIGIYTPIMRRLTPVNFVKFDIEEQAPFRNEHGRCIPAATDEVGLMIVKVIKDQTDFYGYHGNKKATESKYLYDVFEAGDVFVNTGDLMRVDKDCYVYFNDRVGDTFRWKGENVSTLEVSNLLTDLDFILDANVYGVLVPGGDGRAGMASVLLTDTKLIDLSQDMVKSLSKHVNDSLPTYARPKFIRVKQEFEMTSTFKQQKTLLVKEGFDINMINDPLYYYDNTAHAYQRMNGAIYEQILRGEIQF